jgi:hypothetical protein
VQAIIHLESFFPCEKRIEFIDSIVEKFLTPEPSQGELSSLGDKEEISSIFLEVIFRSCYPSWFNYAEDMLLQICGSGGIRSVL